MKSKQAGFTLIELLVTLAITGFIGLVASQLITTSFKAQLSVKKEARQLEDSARVWLKIENDLSQIIDRPIVDALGKQEAALILQDEVLTFTRSGWANPLNNERSQYQRVSYHLDDSSLVRRFWRVLDRSPESEPIEQSFLDVTLFEVEVMAQDGEWITQWPKSGATVSSAGALQGKASLPVAIKVLMAIDNKPEFTRLFEVVSYAEDSQPAAEQNNEEDSQPAAEQNNEEDK